MRSDYVITRSCVYVLRHSNGTVTIEYSNISLFVSALLNSMPRNTKKTLRALLENSSGHLDLKI